MRNLLQRPHRFNELHKSLKGISQKVLTDSLRSMESDGIITRTVYAEVPPRVEYALSELARLLNQWKYGELNIRKDKIYRVNNQ
ncbi:winged helix-turn-helix transcriptional regulator [uncultured Clostridium sp.]